MPFASDPLEIYYPNGGTLANQMYIWNGIKPVLWDGSVTFSGSLPSTVAGNLTNNNAAPAANNLGVLPAIANAAAPSWTEGRQVLLSTDLAGNLRVAATISTAGLATSANQTNASQKTQIVDGSGNVIGSTSNALDVNVVNASIAVTGPLTDTQLRATAVPISAASLPLPSNASQETGGNLAAIKAKTDNIPPLGQALAAASVPVVLTAAQLSTLTPPAAITNYALETGGNLATLAGIVSSARAAVNLISGQAAITGGAGTVAANTPRVTLASDDPAVAVLGATSGAKVITDANGTIQQYLRGLIYQLITQGISFVVNNQATDFLYNGVTALTPKWSTITASSSGANTQVASVSSKKIRVIALALTSSGTVNVKFQSHTTPTDKTGLFYEIANTGFVLPYNPLGWFETIAGEALDINLSGNIAVGGVLQYVEV